MLLSRRTFTALAASFTLGGAILVTGCQPNDPAGPTVTGVQLGARGGGMGGGGGPKVDAADPPSASPNTTLNVRVLGSGFDDGSVASFTINGNPQAEFHGRRAPPSASSSPSASLMWSVSSTARRMR